MSAGLDGAPVGATLDNSQKGSDMQVTVLGMGHGGTTMAADLSLKGHDVTLVKTSDSIHRDHHEHLLNGGPVTLSENGESRSTSLFRVTDDLSSAVGVGVQVVIVFTQTNQHEALVERLGYHLRGHEVVLFEPGYLSTAYVLKHSLPPSLTLAEATSSPIDCRIVRRGEVQVSFRNVANHVGVFPNSRLEFASESLRELGYNWDFLDSPIEAALHNPNLIVHTVGAIMSMPRIEATRGEYWMYREVFTPSVWDIVEALDGEKMSVLRRLGFHPLEYVEACKQRNSRDQSRNAKEVFFDYAMNSSVKGPSAVRSRYITEDVPEGLVLLESLGKLLGVDTPVCSSLITLAGAALRADFREVGRTIERLGRGNLERIIAGQ